MDFFLIVLAIGGLVFALAMLVLASRARRMDRESDARVQRLQALAAGSVLFASEAVVEAPDALVRSADEFFEFADEIGVPEASQPVPAVTFDTTANAYPFVMTVPAGAGRVPRSFGRTQRRSRT